jgi:ubiquinone/menaquinone biosynthesis C-methylase UbiE
MGTAARMSHMNVREVASKFYWKAEHFIAPELRSSQYGYYDALRRSVAAHSRWLDLGCGHQVFAEWMTTEQQELIDKASSLVGIDQDWQGLAAHSGIRKKVFGNVTCLPFRAGSFDVVSANMVVEHLESPGDVLTELRRVLAPGGLFVFHTPNYYHWGTLSAASMPDGPKKLLIRLLEGRAEADVFPTHYRMNTSGDVRRLAAKCGFDVLDIRFVSSSASLQMLGPLVLPELLYIRMIQRDAFSKLRSNLVVTLRRSGDSA